jgi:hypothetical protein
VFISWSGELSRKLGEALRDWLPKALQSVKPYFSPNDIEKGTRWDAEVAGELEASDIGIVCVTPDNRERPWILFEAGALSKAVGKARVCPLLFGGLKPADVSGPLASFQLTRFDKEDFGKLLGTVNGALGEGQLSEMDLAEVFATWWPKLEQSVAEALDVHGGGSAPERREVRDMVEELLELARARDGCDSVVGPELEQILRRPTMGAVSEACEAILSNPGTQFLLEQSREGGRSLRISVNDEPDRSQILRLVSLVRRAEAMVILRVDKTGQIIEISPLGARPANRRPGDASASQ